MKKKNTLVRCIVAAAAVAGIAYLVVRYFDAIHAWLRKLCPCCTLEDDFVVEDHFTPTYHEPVEEVDTDYTPSEETAVEEHDVEISPETDKTPVADESDFEEA